MDSVSIKKVLIEELIVFDKICRENSLTYSLAFGTLLGAVRHKGFIPWDDDVDVMMPRNDYEKLLKLKYNSNEYQIISSRYHSEYCYSFAKLVSKKYSLLESYRSETCLGIYIDIFPYDYVPNSSFKRNIFIKNSVLLTRLNYYLTSSNKCAFKGIISTKKKIVFLLLANLPISLRNRIARKIDQRAKKNDKSNYISCPVFMTPSENKYFSSNIFDNIVYLDFDNYKFSAISSWSHYLEAYYGDYMKLPPEDKRDGGHNYVIREQ